MGKKAANDINAAKPSHLKYFFFVFLSIGALVSGSISVLYHLESKEYLRRLELEEKAGLAIKKETIQNRLEAVASDLMFLAGQNELKAYFKSGGTGHLAAVAREYAEMARHKGVYDQIRYLDHTGMEIVRVNHNNGHPAAVSRENMQSKGDRDYFNGAIALAPGAIFVSPFDLNMEKGSIETPLKPMIRFGTPVYDHQQQKQGVVLLNYMGRHLIDEIKRAGNYAAGNIMLVNADGYWLSSPNPSDEWGFVIEARAHRKFPADFPLAWQRISTAPESQMYMERGLFTATTIHPLGPGRENGKSSRPIAGPAGYWKLISHLPDPALYKGSRSLMVKLFFLAGVLFSLAAIPSWLIAQAMVKRRIHQRELYQSANFDRLTKLPNRGLFLDRLDQVLAQSIRYKRSFALLFIDLDGFKAINDKWGHDAGDAVLVETARRFSNAVRGSDTVARLGGDEFTIILNTLAEIKNAEMVAKKIIGSLAAPVACKGHLAKISASIGISVYPDHGRERDTLLKKADDAMYRAKGAGKNRYRLSAD